MKASQAKALSRKIEHGAWVRDIPGAGDLQLKVRARFNIDYRRRQKELFEAEPAENKPNGVLTDEAAERHDRILLHETVLIGWANWEDDDGQPIPFSLEESAKHVLPPDEPVFRSWVNWAAMNVADLGELELRAAEGN
ncbi:hypothetical protein [Hansschlegelia sp.]|uniref:hypothetical protein n=1 Tax=Hansschlegelia sp. TaxID=2041892 RepID=UPI002CB44B1D|nr:hypothetical protein [Hansschlegelia sp.]HVI28856.1 hypothetical protein [Hansschlegelia sp.]